MGNCFRSSGEELMEEGLRSESVSKRRKSIADQLMSVTNREELEGATYAGDLWKKSDWKHEWRERHLILHGSTIHNFKGDEKSSSEGVHLNEKSTVVIVDSEGPPSINYCFEVSGSKSWTCAVKTAAERGRWISHINDVIQDIILKQRFDLELKDIMRKGQCFQKYHNDTFANLRNKERRRIVKVDNDCEMIQWSKLDEVKEYDRISVSSIKQVVKGKQTAAFRGTIALDADLCFSVIARERTLDLVADSVPLRDIWVDAINGLIKFGNEDSSVVKKEKMQNALLKVENALHERQNDESRQKFQELIIKNKTAKAPQGKKKRW